MASTGDRGGKYKGVDLFGHQYDKKVDWGTRHWLHQGEWGNKSWFIGSGERSFEYIDPETGITVTIRADSVKDAARQARNAGLIKKRKRKR